MTTCYTCITNNHDTLKSQPKQSVETRFVCLSDTLDLKSDDTWEVRYIKMNERSHRADSYINKCLHYFPDSEISIWIDGEAIIKTDKFTEDLLKYLGDDDFLCFAHPDRHDVYEEAEFCMNFPKWQDQNMLEQVESYRKEGLPEKSGLFAGGLLVRRQDKCEEINQAWWQEQLKWGNMDQLSLPYVAWKLGFKIKTLPLNQWNNYLIDYLTYTHNTTK